MGLYWNINERFIKSVNDQ